MGFFQDLKEDLSMAVNELIPEEGEEIAVPSTEMPVEEVQIPAESVPVENEPVMEVPDAAADDLADAFKAAVDRLDDNVEDIPDMEDVISVETKVPDAEYGILEQMVDEAKRAESEVAAPVIEAGPVVMQEEAPAPVMPEVAPAPTVMPEAPAPVAAAPVMPEVAPAPAPVPAPVAAAPVMPEVAPAPAPVPAPAVAPAPAVNVQVAPRVAPAPVAPAPAVQPAVSANPAPASAPSLDGEASDETAVITAGMAVNGNMVSRGSMDIMGQITGNIEILGKLNITGTVNGSSRASEIFADSAKINGDIVASGSVKIGQGTVIIGNVFGTAAVIAGAVKGDIDVKGPVILDTTAIVMGNIKSKAVQINNGAVIEGIVSQCYADVSPVSFFESLS